MSEEINMYRAGRDSVVMHTDQQKEWIEMDEDDIMVLCPECGGVETEPVEVGVPGTRSVRQCAECGKHIRE